LDRILKEFKLLFKQIKNDRKTDKAEPRTPVDKSVDRNEEMIKKSNSFIAVNQALTKILGPNPKEKSKLRPEVFTSVLRLDQLLQQEEEERSRLERLADSALQLVREAASQRELAEKILSKRHG